jgi:hypothetical protein
MRRQEVIRLLRGAALWPRAAGAQQTSQAADIGFMGSGTAAALKPAKGASSFQQILGFQAHRNAVWQAGV